MIKLNSTTWKHVQKDDWRERLEVIIGDDKQPDFKPQIKILKWSNECNASFRLVDDEKVLPVIKKVGKKLKYIKNKKELHFYNIEPNEKLREGGYEFEVVLKEKPSTNKLRFTIRTKGLKFYYQPPLTEEIKVGDKNGRIVKVTETDVYAKNEKGELISVTHRPENVVGSYAVYHATKGAMNNVKGGKLYRVGKAFHIYRPKITDANGNWTWGKLNIDEKSGILTIEIDQNFLDNAVYPVKVDPTFGYDTKGGSETYYSSWAGQAIYATAYTISEDGQATSLTQYVKYYGSDDNNKQYGIYTDDNGEPANLLARTDTWTVPADWDDWKELSLTTANPNLTGSTTYWLAHWEGYMYYYYDAGATTKRTDTLEYGDLPDTFPTVEATYDRKVSIYCTYTAGGGEEEAPSPNQTLNLLGVGN